MKLNFLCGLFGRDSRAAQRLNCFCAALWVVMLWCNNHNVILLSLPSKVLDNHLLLATLSILTVMFSVLSIFCVSYTKQVLKVFAFILGSLTQALVASFYVSAYPPLDMMLFVSTLLSLWWLGAVLYIVKCEGVNGDDQRKP